MFESYRFFLNSVSVWTGWYCEAAQSPRCPAAVSRCFEAGVSSFGFEPGLVTVL